MSFLHQPRSSLARRRRALCAALAGAAHPLRLFAALAALRTAPGAAQEGPDHGGSAGLPEPALAQSVADGVWMLAGANSAPTAANLGRVGNAGFIVGSRGVALIDTGSSRARARELLAAIRRVTPLPLEVVLITHPAQEFLFGASLFLDQGIPVLSHPATPRLMAERCQHCLDTLTGELGAERMQGSRLAPPTGLALPPADIDLGNRRVHLLPGPEGSVPGNLRVHDLTSGVLFTGALLSVHRVPGVQDTRPQDWIRALKVLDDPALYALVPAYGPLVRRAPAAGSVSIRDACAGLADYLAALEARARALYAAATPLADVGRDADLPAFRDWNGYSSNHLHNIFYRYLQLEAEDLASQ